MRSSAVATTAAGVLVAVVLSACGGIAELQHTATETTPRPSQTGTLSQTSPLRSVTPLTHTAPARLRARGGHAGVGTAQSVISRDAHLTVTLLRVIDPLRG